ncbi:MAG: precorrin-3B C(17)-methyltransferase [Desulfobacteraceae bacterium]|nr:precorrin-3B C(17)-methyltransferase [Desulfobacteraceae bacterium]
MRSSSNSGSSKRETDCGKAEDKKCNTGRGQNNRSLYIVGIGPGSPDHMSARALSVLKDVDTVAGYTTYIDLIRNLVADKNIIATAMKKEIDRVKAAIDTALSGKSCAIVSSGDSGIYAMAGLALEICKERKLAVFSPQNEQRDEHALRVEIVPGIPALSSGASLLGAPLTHDFACISLSDLLTPWELIEKRIEYAAKADFVLVIFNPKSKKRNWQLGKTMEIVLKYRDGNTPVGIVKNAMRKSQDVSIVSLSELADADVDMLTTVFIGSTQSSRYRDFMYTPRGYSGKYAMD